MDRKASRSSRRSSIRLAAAAALVCALAAANAGVETAYDTWYGIGAGANASTGNYNTYLGIDAGRFTTSAARHNVFVGTGAGFNNISPVRSTVVGSYAGGGLGAGTDNSFFGTSTGYSTSSGSYNTFSGAESGFYNTTGGHNTFHGSRAGYHHTTGLLNTFVGRGAGLSSTAENHNTALGAYADVSANLRNATAIGFQAKVRQSDSLVLGSIPGVNITNGGPNRYVAVGMGTDRPAAPLHVKRHVAGTGELALFENASTTAANRVMLEMVNNGGASINFTHSGTSQTWALRAWGSGNGVFDVYRVGGSNLMRVSSAGNVIIAGTLTQNSNVHDKTGIEAVDPQAVLGKVQALPISRWRYKDDGGSTHVGPMAQDFHAAFGLGEDATRIAPGDMAGVALAAIQAQQAQLAAQRDSIEALKAENAALRADLQALAAGLGRRP